MDSDKERELGAQVEWVKGKVARSRGSVAFLPSIGWETPLFQRPHHLARAFALRGWVTVFDSRGSNDRVFGFLETEPEVFLFNGPPELLADVPFRIVWAFPYNIQYRKDYDANASLVYDWIDALDVFPYRASFLAANHRLGLRSADLVTCVSRPLLAEAARVRPDALYVPNGVEAWRFLDETGPVPYDGAVASIRAGGKPVVGYYGALARWFDFELLDEVAGLRPDWEFLLIGPDLDNSTVHQSVFCRPNVTWIGPRDYASLPLYVRLFTVAMIPFRINCITESTSPLKLYEFFAAGKPVICTPMPECRGFPATHVVRTASEFATALDGARGEAADVAVRTSLREVAQKHSWLSRVGEVLERLSA